MSHLLHPVTYDRFAALQAVLWMAGAALALFVLFALFCVLRDALTRPHRAWRKK